MSTSNQTIRRRWKSVTLRARLDETPEEYLLHIYTPGVAGMPDGTYFTLTSSKHDKAADEARDRRTNTLHCQELVRSYIFHKTLPGLATRYMSAREEQGLGYWRKFCYSTEGFLTGSGPIELDRGDLHEDFTTWCRENEVVNAP